MSALDELRERTAWADDVIGTLVGDAPDLSPATRDRLAVLLRDAS